MVNGTAGTGTWGAELGRVSQWLGVNLIEVVQREPLWAREGTSVTCWSLNTVFKGGLQCSFVLLIPY